MKNPIKKIEIKNFKTVKNVSLDCKRINIIIGKPNVGKSNILEAMSLYALSYTTNSDKVFSEFVRYDFFEELFYDKEITNDIEVKSDIGIARVSYNYGNNNFSLKIAGSKKDITELGEGKSGRDSAKKLFASNKKEASNGLVSPYFSNIDIKGKELLPNITSTFGASDKGRVPFWSSPIKRYEFVKDSIISNRNLSFLMPPFGNNLFAIVNSNKKLFKELSLFFKEYKLDFVMDTKLSKFFLQKKVNGVIYTYDYALIADTLQRYIFNLMAIESNSESILLFEEPEAHMFPPYAKGFANKIIESTNNQFFITTHSPFVLNTIIENAPISDVAVFVTTYEKFQTKVKPLTQSELEDMLNYGNDIFFSEKLNG